MPAQYPDLVGTQYLNKLSVKTQSVIYSLVACPLYVNFVVAGELSPAATPPEAARQCAYASVLTAKINI
ncbi:MAG: hypothetical protein A2538_03245 [Candidatus Magasanikbacteria bacterium RIFOXYD2_FULL_41_14]|uniref:Uncharacterized protein n=1 Tax=Candidatus Magasanikbacteria bacterium RIFOXYD2_FULL_41_14 TaxID=1798709 RepID=A0A1F6PCG6_9BACT|nr:MAG: hypothetical protein A2538_03245 [Candidatus Magasanikbacteria bacterium RIFOXYD2_FULL_41_14]